MELREYEVGQRKQCSKNLRNDTATCRTQKNDPATDAQNIPNEMSEHSSSLPIGNENARREDGELYSSINDDRTDVLLADCEEVRMTIAGSKNNKAARTDDPPTELFKYGGKEMCMLQSFQISLHESMHNDWSSNVLCTIHRKGHPIVCTTYRGISLLIILY